MSVSVQISLTPPFATPVWQDVTAECLEFDTTAGKQHALDRVETGTFDGTFDNRGGQFNPWYFLGQSTVVPINVPLRVTASWGGTSHPIFWGLIDSVSPDIHDELNVDSAITASDLLKYLSNTYISSNYYAQQILGTSGLVAYYRLDEAQGATTHLHDLSGNGYTAHVAGHATLGAPGVILYDTDTALDLGNSTANAGGYAVCPTGLTAAIGTTWSIEGWFQANLPMSKGSATLFSNVGSTWWSLIAFPGDPNPAVNDYNLAVQPNAGTFLCDSGNHYCDVLDGSWHHVVVTQTVSGSNTVTLIYVDGVNVANKTQPTSNGPPNGPFYAGTQLAVGYEPSRAPGIPTFAGIVDEVAVYNVVLTPTQVEAHADMGQWFYKTDYSGDRVAQTLTVIGVPPSNWGGSAGTHGGTIAQGKVQVASGQDGVSSAGGTPMAMTDQSALDYIQTVEQTENGQFYQLPSGQLAFRDQNWCYTNPTSTTSQVTFADKADATCPYHYRPGLKLVLDDQDVWNVIQVQPVNGITQTVFNQGSINIFGYRLQQDRSGVLAGTQQQAKNLANLILLQYSYPLIRVESLECSSAINNGAAMPYLLGLYLFDSFSLERVAAPGVPNAFGYPLASGYTHPDVVAYPPTPDYSTEPGRFVIENIRHRVTPGLNSDGGTFLWTTTWAGSPYELQGSIFFLKLDIGQLDQNTLGP